MRIERDVADDIGKVLDDALNTLGKGMDDFLDGMFPCTPGVNGSFIDTMDTMLLMVYVQLLTPLFSIVFNCICNQKNKDGTDQRAGGGVGLTGFVSMISGALYLAFYYKVNGRKIEKKTGNCRFFPFCRFYPVFLD